MKKFAFLFLLTFTIMELVAQQEKPVEKTVSENFEKLYNQRLYDSIYQLLTPAFQMQLTREGTKSFFSGLMQQAGKITSRNFVGYENGFASYKTGFERGLFAVNIAMSKESKISGLLIKPFEATKGQHWSETRLHCVFLLMVHGTWFGVVIPKSRTIM